MTMTTMPINDSRDDEDDDNNSITANDYDDGDDDNSDPLSIDDYHGAYFLQMSIFTPKAPSYYGH